MKCYLKIIFIISFGSHSNIMRKVLLSFWGRVLYLSPYHKGGNRGRRMVTVAGQAQQHKLKSNILPIVLKCVTNLMASRSDFVTKRHFFKLLPKVRNCLLPVSLLLPLISYLLYSSIPHLHILLYISYLLFSHIVCFSVSLILALAQASSPSIFLSLLLSLSASTRGNLSKSFSSIQL